MGERRSAKERSSSAQTARLHAWRNGLPGLRVVGFLIPASHIAALPSVAIAIARVHPGTPILAALSGLDQPGPKGLLDCSRVLLLLASPCAACLTLAVTFDVQGPSCPVSWHCPGSVAIRLRGTMTAPDALTGCCALRAACTAPRDRNGAHIATSRNMEQAGAIPGKSDPCSPAYRYWRECPAVPAVSCQVHYSRRTQVRGPERRPKPGAQMHAAA